ncbi:4-hydroxybutyrate dehydrogenase [Clostridium frigidicarnis]|uniref:4-hydroxybutyrate dehydrogenase n=1 Tax=Clostridium frigidicarnis TaxID=84698 RepID=A0A1I0X4L9_9CLOT|nr:4-hydroxybutyrate dehydrogenase [Clostridium frigidicarnis]SFA95330.1 4-hydroxybutyrate dehydrogenase [Clostridium frigidicarnis]
MKLLEIKPEIHKFNSCLEFVEEFRITKEDLIFTNKRIYNDFLKGLNLNCNYIFKDNYNFNEPNDEVIDSMLKDLKFMNFKRVIAIGGGSIVDIGKLLALKDVSNTEALFNKEIKIEKDKELIIVPTTCGTGSEVTNISITEIKSKKTKMGLAVDELYADHAVLIPDLCNSVPYKFFVYSSIDALIHAIESFVSPKANYYTEVFSIEAIKMILNGYKDIIKNGKEYRLKLMEQFLIASNYAGIAFGNAGVGAVHALSYPLGGSYHVPHGEANYEFLIEVFKFYNEKNPNGKINRLNEVLSNILECKKEEVYNELYNVLNNLIHIKPLREYGMKEEEIYSFSEKVIKSQQRLLNNNYVEMNKEDMIKIYKKLY